MVRSLDKDPELAPRRVLAALAGAQVISWALLTIGELGIFSDKVN